MSEELSCRVALFLGPVSTPLRAAERYVGISARRFRIDVQDPHVQIVDTGKCTGQVLR